MWGGDGIPRVRLESERRGGCDRGGAGVDPDPKKEQFDRDVGVGSRVCEGSEGDRREARAREANGAPGVDGRAVGGDGRSTSEGQRSGTEANASGTRFISLSVCGSSSQAKDHGLGTVQRSCVPDLTPHTLSS